MVYGIWYVVLYSVSGDAMVEARSVSVKEHTHQKTYLAVSQQLSITSPITVVFISF